MLLKLISIDVMLIWVRKREESAFDMYYLQEVKSRCLIPVHAY